MQSNPYPNEPFDRQPTEVNPQMEPLQPRDPQYPQPVQNTPPVEQQVSYPEAVRAQERASTFAYGLAKLGDYIWWILLVLEIALFLRFVLKLIAADPYNPFANFLYGLTNVFLFIFKGIVRDQQFGASVFEWSTVIGMLIYALIFWALRLLLKTAVSRPQERA